MSDLISREDLKEALSDKDLITYTHEYGDAIPVGWVMSVIDNAPTVSEITKEKLAIAYEQGYEDGKNNWLQEEKPQCKCENCDLYFKAITKEEMKKGGIVPRGTHHQERSV